MGEPFRYLSVCSGIEAASVAWSQLGWQSAGLSEIEPFPRAVLEQRLGAAAVDWGHRHQPGRNSIPLFGDFTQIEAHHVGPVDLLVGGTPCQSFSVAGKRLGLDDPRGNLALEYLALARRLGARWIVWENVPGVLSSFSGGEQAEREVRDGGGSADGFEDRDFATFLAFVRQCGFGFAYRVLDAQYVRVDGLERAVPQRRRRVILVGYLGDWRRAAAVLFECEGLRGDPAPRRKAGEGVAPTISARPSGGGGLGTDFDCDGGLIAAEVCGALCADTHPGAYTGQDAYTGRLVAFGGNNTAGAIDVSTALTSHGGPHGRLDFESETFIAFDCKGTEVQVSTDGSHPTLRSMGHHNSHQNAGGHAVVAISGSEQWAVRRLTPTECERLQGFPDGWTDIAWRGKAHAPDGPRYKALGNSMATNVMRWVGERIAMVEALDL